MSRLLNLSVLEKPLVLLSPWLPMWPFGSCVLGDLSQPVSVAEACVGDPFPCCCVYEHLCFVEG